MLLPHHCRARGEGEGRLSPLLYGNKIPAIGFVPQMTERVVSKGVGNPCLICERPFGAAQPSVPLALGKRIISSPKFVLVI